MQTLCDSMREAARQVDTPCCELHSEAFADEACRLVDQLNAGVTKTLIKVFDNL